MLVSVSPHEEHADRRPCSPLVADVHVEQVKADGVVTFMTVDRAEPLLAGHYPGFPILPGVCLVECVHRSVLARAEVAKRHLELDAVESTRFLQPVFPDDGLTTEVRIDQAENSWRCTASVSTGRGKAADVRLRYRFTQESLSE